MSEGWKQIWDDIRQALGVPVAEPAGPEDAESQTASTEATLGTGSETEIATEPIAPDTPHQRSDTAEMPLIAPSLPMADANKTTALDRTSFSEILIAPPALPEAEPISESPDETSPNARSAEWLPRALTVGLILLGIFLFFRDRLFIPEPPAPNIVATFEGGQITIDEVRQHLAVLVPDEGMRSQLQTFQAYQAVIQEMIMDELVRRWAADRDAERDTTFQHVMQHLSEDINLDELHTKMHEGQMGVTAGDIQAYYDANRAQFGQQTLTQAREQIRAILQSQQEDQFVENYIAGLKDKATITRDFALLSVPEPAEQELQAYYQANMAQYLLPAQATVNEIRVALGTDEATAQTQADKALIRLRSGADFATVANDVSETPFAAENLTISKGQRDPIYDEIVFALDEGELSQVFRAGDAFYIVRLQAIEPERQLRLDEVRDSVRQAVLTETEAAWFEENANRTLLTIDGKRYTVGEFWQEYQELPLPFVAGYQGLAGRQALAERLIERLLLIEDSYDQLLETDNQDELEEVRLDILMQMLEQEEVDDKIEVTDEELRAFYEQHQIDLVEPPQSRIRQIIIRLGQTEDEHQRAIDKANEAYEKLVPGLFQEGADFAEIVREYSEDEATVAQGGEVPGWIGEGPDLMTEIVEHPLHQQIAFLSAGQISRPFEWNGAVYIIQVLEQTEPRPLPFEEVEASLREELRLRKHDELSAQLFDNLITQANVTVYDQALQQLMSAESQAISVD